MTRSKDLLYVSQELSRLGTILDFKRISLSDLDEYIIENINLLNEGVSEENYDYRLGLAEKLQGQLLELIKKNDLEDFNNLELLISHDLELKRDYIEIEDEDAKSLMELLIVGVRAMALDYRLMAEKGEEDESLAEFIRLVLGQGLKKDIALEELGQLTVKMGEYFSQILASKNRILADEYEKNPLDFQKIVSFLNDEKLEEIKLVIGNKGNKVDKDYYRGLGENIGKNSLLISAGSINNIFKDLNFEDREGLPLYHNLGDKEACFDLIMLSLMIKEARQAESLNDIPVEYNLIINDREDLGLLFSLMYLGVKNIKVDLNIERILNDEVKDILQREFQLEIRWGCFITKFF